MLKNMAFFLPFLQDSIIKYFFLYIYIKTINMKKCNILATIIFSFVFFACQPQEPQKKESTYLSPNIEESAKKNPYYIENMRKALLLMGEKDQADKLKATHFYVKFRIQTSDEVAWLVQNNIDVSSTPLDVLKENKGEKIVHSNNQKEGELFGVLPVNKQLGEIKYETLYPLYIPNSGQFELEQFVFNLLGISTQNSSAPQLGRILFYDPISQENKPLQGVKVVLREFAKKQEAISDQNGQFVFANRIITPNPNLSIVFDNSYCEIRHFTVENILELFLPIHYGLGNIYLQAGKDITISINQNENTNALLQTAAATLSALNNHRSFSEYYGYLRPQRKMNIWLAKDALLSTSYAAPMLRNIALERLGNIKLLLQKLFGLPEPISNSLVHLVKSALPDIYAPYYSNYNLGVPSGYIETLFHEFSHSVHFAKVGAEFWTTYIQHIYTYGGYGNGNQPLSGLVAISESWAEDLSFQCAKWNYGTTLYPKALLDYNTSPAYSWIPWGLYYDLYDEDTNETWDQVQNIRFEQIYALLSGEVNTPQKLKTVLKANFDQLPGMEVSIDLLFNHYGF